MKYFMCLLLFLCGCSLWNSETKTPLTPQGQLNVCIRDRVLAYENAGKTQSMGIKNAARKIAGECTDELKLFEMYNQAVINAENMMQFNSPGTSLGRRY